MKKAVVILSCLLVASTASFAAAQTGNDQATASAQEITKAAAAKVEQAKAVQATEQFNPRFVRTLTNVQVELTLTDQTGNGTPEKKTVSMIVSSGNWGKIRSAGTVRPAGDAPFGVVLNVDARPFVSVDGPVQLELTLEYFPAPAAGDAKSRPMGINQSQTVVLQSGKPLIISQAADPLVDRKVVVEVKATVLK